MLHKSQTGIMPAFYAPYIAQLPDTDILEVLAQQPAVLKRMLLNLTETKAEKGYAPGKWSLKEVVGHMIDAERVFAYRCLCISRHEKQPLPGFDENKYVEAAGFNTRTLASLADEFTLTRQANLYLFSNLTEAMQLRLGQANGEPVSAQAFILIAAGHVQHHLNIIQLKYLP